MYDFDKMDKRLIVFGYLFRVANRLQSKMDAQMKDLTAKQWFVILVLGLFEQPPTLKQLAAACDTSHQNTKQLVMKLAEKGFVTVHNDEKDGRSMRIKASEQWEQWDKDNEQIATQFIESMFSGVSMDEVADLSSSLMKIFDNLDNINGGT
ncbi:MAG: MarR family transcriptional regulator [[Clostridium] symbiosum]|uniref:DNA-binding transcriptional regulator, MarR family n=1 Tax=Anaerotignum propionicum DSM 1682 TaxID=991789 RepID=A0A0X1U8G5_ANAPI|nr:MarR family transcriptional regulator [Anaerotignum propionicum]AMJ41260.1 transcriptional regulator SlyA [Anaerotignum propionicum DSM 1682]MEA4841899.1 MarR family transcriptional regulator [[Clostridium] symbiosum]SHF06102.1 DNA-binding transcriptional regulator, MarR family [[Clostridium] propionicum DSM 1682] [Anaerotignum propionicum DSM 1682]